MKPNGSLVHLSKVLFLLDFGCRRHCTKRLINIIKEKGLLRGRYGFVWCLQMLLPLLQAVGNTQAVVAFPLHTWATWGWILAYPGWHLKNFCWYFGHGGFRLKAGRYHLLRPLLCIPQMLMFWWPKLGDLFSLSTLAGNCLLSKVWENQQERSWRIRWLEGCL